MKKGFRILKFKKDKAIFEVKDVSKSFDGRPILKKLSLKVFPGECVGILGPAAEGAHPGHARGGCVDDPEHVRAEPGDQDGARLAGLSL